MKKILISLLSCTFLLSAILLSACGESKSIDEQFISAWQAGLSARWKLTDAADADATKNNTREDYESFINAELDQISKYKEETFEDEDLGSIAKDYISILEKANESLTDFGTDKWYADWNSIQQDRYAILVSLDEKIQPEFSEDSDKKNYQSLLNQGKVVLAVRDLMTNTKFEKVASDYGWSDYEVKVKNTAGVDFDYFGYNINLVDKDGVVVETQYAGTENWTADSTHKFEFSTDAEFDKIEIPNCDYSF